MHYQKRCLTKSIKPTCFLMHTGKIRISNDVFLALKIYLYHEV